MTFYNNIFIQYRKNICQWNQENKIMDNDKYHKTNMIIDYHKKRHDKIKEPR